MQSNYKRVGWYSLFLAVALAFTACSSDKIEDPNPKPGEKEKVENTLEGTGVTNTDGSSTTTAQSVIAKETLTLNFKSADTWTATTSDQSIAKLSKTSGAAGENQIVITGGSVIGQQAEVVVKVKGYKDSAAYKVLVVDATALGDVTTDTLLNNKIHDLLRQNYLYDEEYTTLTVNKKQAYDDFLRNTLIGMQTNTLDKRPSYSAGTLTGYRLFSRIEKLDPNLVTTSSTHASRATSWVEKEKTYSYGIVGATVFRTSNTYYGLAVQGVYPDSPAANAGMDRNVYLTIWNGDSLTWSKTLELYGELFGTPAAGRTITLKDQYGGKTYTLTSVTLEANPVLKTQVEEVDGKKIGYLAYSEFHAGWDEELFDAFKEFKDKGVTDFVLDLRYNGGGHVISANLIASCIAGSASIGKVFMSDRLNSRRMKLRNNQRENTYFSYSRYQNLNNTSLSAGALNLNTVYILTGNGTASASELVINSLRGIDMNVVLIGETTYGKNVGMEVSELKDAQNNSYRLVPITFQSYNAKGFGDYEDGFTPNYTIDEADPENKRVFVGYFPYGSGKDPLYAKAYELITGKKPSTASRAGYKQAVGAPAELTLPSRHRIGMIK